MKKQFSIKTMVFLGFGFLGITAAWTFYNSFVPIILKKFITSNLIIGMVMTLDNIMALTIQPIAGALSDRTNSRFGRRKPFILFAAPFSILLFSLIPFINIFWLLIAVIILMNISMAVYRSPVIALMPDLVEPENRSKANGIINFMGGIGALIALFIGGVIFDQSRPISFIFIAVVLATSLLLLYVEIKESNNYEKGTADELPTRLIKVIIGSIAITAGFFYLLYKADFLNIHIQKFLGDPIQGKIIAAIVLLGIIVIFQIRSSLPAKSLFIFLAIFFWFFGYNSIETFFTLFGKESLGITAGQGSMLLGVFSLSFIIFAIPSGLIGQKLGRGWVILIGLFVLTFAILSILFIKNIIMIAIAMVIGGAGWAAININSYPLICNIGSDTQLGTLTGLYYFFSMLAQTISPPVSGMVIDKSGSYYSIFIIAAGAFVLAGISVILFVRRTFQVMR